MAKQRFVVVAGKHIEDGKTYTKGQTVLSSKPLDKLFRNKFQPVGVGQPVPQDPVEDDEEEEDETLNEDEISEEEESEGDTETPVETQRVKVKKKKKKKAK